MDTKTILLIEDNVSTLASYMQILKSMDLHIFPLAAQTYEKGKELIASVVVDLVILDLFLPDAVSTDILEDLRSRLFDVPVFIVTGYPEKLDQEKARRFGVRQVFPKPFRVETFCEAIQSSLQHTDSAL